VEITVSGDAGPLNGGKAMIDGRLHVQPNDLAMLRRIGVRAPA